MLSCTAQQISNHKEHYHELTSYNEAQHVSESPMERNQTKIKKMLWIHIYTHTYTPMGINIVLATSNLQEQTIILSQQHTHMYMYMKSVIKNGEVLDNIYTIVHQRALEVRLTLSGCRQQETQCSYTVQQPSSLQVLHWYLTEFEPSALQQSDGSTSDNGHTYPIQKESLHETGVDVSMHDR